MNTFHTGTILVILGIGHLAGAACAQAPDPPVTPQATVVAKQVDAYNAKDLDAFLATYGPEAALYNLDTGKKIASGTDELRKRYAHRFSGSPDLHATIRKRLAIENYVIDRESVIKKKGEPRSEAIAVYYVRDKLIRGVWFLFFDEGSAKPTRGVGKVVKNVFDVTNTQDVGRILGVYAEDIKIRTLPGNGVAVDGPDELSRRLTRSFDFDSGLQVAISDTIEAGDFVVVHEQIASSTGPQFHDFVIYDIKSGKVRRSWSLLP